MTFPSAGRFLIVDPAFPLRVVLSPTDLQPGCSCAILAPCRLSHGEGPPFDHSQVGKTVIPPREQEAKG
jgi:hypothetical protein